MFVFICVLMFAILVTTTSTENNTKDEFSKLFAAPTTTVSSNKNETQKEKIANEPAKTSQSSQSQQIERTIEPFLISSDNFENKNYNNKSTKLEKVNKLGDFKPSPQLETIYEYNKFPVIPAFPEAKQINGLNTGEFPVGASIPWVDKFPPTTEQPWYSRIKFPTPQVSSQTTKEYPYSFMGDTNKEKKPLFGYTSKNKPSSFDQSKPTSGLDKSTQKLGGGFGTVSKVPFWEKPIMHKTHYDYNVYDSKPQSFDIGDRHNYGSVSHHHQDHGLPWKKIIKFLTAFIPIGLLISALTPTVITVSSVNNTQLRSRKEDSNQEAAKRLLVSLNHFNRLNGEGCEERILCELLLSASNSQNAEHHVQNFLNNFGEQQTNVTEKIDKMKKIYEAVQRQNCDVIICENIKGNT